MPEIKIDLHDMLDQIFWAPTVVAALGMFFYPLLVLLLWSPALLGAWALGRRLGWKVEATLEYEQ